MDLNYISDHPVEIKFSRYGFADFWIWCYKIPTDMNCFFHSLLMGFEPSYRRQFTPEGMPLNRKKLVLGVREELAQRLPLYYEKLGQGYFLELAKQFPGEYGLKALQERIRGTTPIAFEILEYCMLIFKINIFILDLETRDVYITGVDPIPEYNCVVLLYREVPLELEKKFPKMVGHFELCGVQFGSQIVTHFKYTNPFIQHLLRRIEARKAT